MGSPAPQSSATASSAEPEDLKPKSEDDPSLAEWYRIEDESSARSPLDSATASETETESDNEDTRQNDGEAGWYDVRDAGRSDERVKVSILVATRRICVVAGLTVG
jgi:hypothetical protein